MTENKRIAIDTSKAVFTLNAVDQHDRPVIRRDVRRAGLADFFAKLAPTEVVMEACGGSHHWARVLSAQGHTVKLIPPQYVKPFVKPGKNDRNDAEAICEAAGRPNMSFVPVKSAQRQAELMVLRTRELLVSQRTQLVNPLRGHATEFGVIAGKGIERVASCWRQLPRIIPFHLWRVMYWRCLVPKSPGSIRGSTKSMPICWRNTRPTRSAWPWPRYPAWGRLRR